MLVCTLMPCSPHSSAGLSGSLLPMICVLTTDSSGAATSICISMSSEGMLLHVHRLPDTGSAARGNGVLVVLGDNEPPAGFVPVLVEGIHVPLLPPSLAQRSLGARLELLY